jgi:hypothetical protein
MTRTDLASPTNIDPAAFIFVAGVYFGSSPGEGFDEMLGEWMSEKNEDGKASWYSERPVIITNFPLLNEAGNFARKGTCDHCGAIFKWGAVYQHKPTGKHIVVGNVCANRTLDVPSRHELDVRQLQSRLAANRLAARKAEDARKQGEEMGFSWLYTTGKHNSKTLDDIASKGLKYGGLTPAQIELVRKIHDGTPTEWQARKDEVKAKREAEEAAAEPVPSNGERIEIKGAILTIKEKEGYMGEVVLKMLVRHATRGFKVWGTVPSALVGAKVGDVVTFSAKVERSNDDPKFGFFSRPTKARMVAAEGRATTETAPCHC